MFFRATPSDERVRRILSGLSDVAYNYAPVGATEGKLTSAPAGFTLSSYGTQLGTGEDVFEAASTVLADFGNYPSSFTRVVRASEAQAIEPGLVFGTLATHFGFASMHPCRIVRVIREEAPRGFGFVLVTLPGHIGAGEESFMLTLGAENHIVRYEVQAISRPDGWMGRLGGPVFRLFQKRFERETQAAMRNACGDRSAN